MSESIGLRIFRLRSELGLSQRELSTPNVSYAFISRIESGHRTPSEKVLRELAPRLGVTPLYLEQGEGVTTCPHCGTKLEAPDSVRGKINKLLNRDKDSI